MSPEDRVALVAELRGTAETLEAGEPDTVMRSAGSTADLLREAADALDGPAQRELVSTCLRWFLGFPGSTIYKRRDGVTQADYERTIVEALDELGVYRKWGTT